MKISLNFHSMNFGSVSDCDRVCQSVTELRLTTYPFQFSLNDFGK